MTSVGVMASAVSAASTVLWGRWDPSDVSSLTISSGVAAIADKSGNGRNLSATAGWRPTSGASINGLNALSYSGTNRFSSAVGGPTALTYFAIVRPASHGSQRYLLHTNIPAAADTFDSLHVIIYSGGEVAWGTGGGSALHNSSSPNLAAIGATTLIVATLTPVGQTSALWVNGVKAATKAFPNPSGNQPVIWFASFNSGSAMFVGDIGEQIIYDGAMSDAEIVAASAPLAAKWGVTLP